MKSITAFHPGFFVTVIINGYDKMDIKTSGFSNNYNHLF